MTTTNDAVTFCLDSTKKLDVPIYIPPKNINKKNIIAGAYVVFYQIFNNTIYINNRSTGLIYLATQSTKTKKITSRQYLATQSTKQKPKFCFAC
jgi:hypothetical protein